MKYYSEDDNVVDRNGKPLTLREKEFLNLMNEIQEKYGFGVVLAFLTIMEAVIKKEKNTKDQNKGNYGKC